MSCLASRYLFRSDGVTWVGESTYGIIPRWLCLVNACTTTARGSSLILACRFNLAFCQVYDLMTKLAELAVTSHHPNLRASAGQTFLTFLLQYPLGEKRLQFHLNQVGNILAEYVPRGRTGSFTSVKYVFYVHQSHNLCDMCNHKDIRCLPACRLAMP